MRFPEFLDRNAWIDSGLRRGDLYAVDRVLREAESQLSADLAKRLIDSIDVGLNLISSTDSKATAFGFRLKGECFDRRNELTKALECYEQALGRNPKAGVKKRVAQIQKILKQSN